MPWKYKHQYEHNIPLEKDIKDMGCGIYYPKYRCKWESFRGNTKIFTIEFTMETQYYYSGGFELLKLTDIIYERFVDNPKLAVKAIRDIIGSDENIRDFYDILCVEEKSRNKQELYEAFEDRAIKGRFICHTFIELFKKIENKI